MRPLIEMFLDNNDERVMHALQQETGLDKSAASRALSAILPAFSTGLKRQTENQDGLEKFMAALSSGRHAAYADDPSVAFKKQNQKEGKGILGHLFGSKDLSRQIASNAATASGIDEQTIKHALPSLANVIMGGLFKQATLPAPSQIEETAAEPMNALGGGGIGGAILGQIMEQMMKKGGGRGQSSGSNNPLNDILEQITGGAQTGGNSGSGNRRRTGNPMNDAFQDMLAGKKSEYQTSKPQRKRETESREPYENQPEDGFEDIGSAKPDFSTRTNQPSSQDGSGGLGDLFGDMLDSGSQEPEEYQRGIESIFDQFMGSDKR